MDFHNTPPVVMHVDLNSCFATVEQQANPLFRGKPTVVAAYTTNNGCILAASKEAKLLGIKTGMPVGEGKRRYQKLIVLPPDPGKYRVVNHQLTKLLGSYTDLLSVESIDEMVLSLLDTPALYRQMQKDGDVLSAMASIAHEMKARIRNEIGEWLTVSIGIAPNRYLAKVASNLQKPDGLRWITKETITEVFQGLELEDLCGIKTANATRLRFAGIPSPSAMLEASEEELARAFHSILGYHWWRRLHGWEDGGMYKSFDETEDPQKTFGQSYALPKGYTPTDPRLWQILAQLVMKMGKRLREAGCTAHGVGLSLLFTDYSHWHTQEKHMVPLFADSDFYERMRDILKVAPERPVRILAVFCYQLDHDIYTQMSLLPEENKKRDITIAIDKVQERFGDFVITPGRMMNMEQRVLDRIAFGKASI